MTASLSVVPQPLPLSTLHASPAAIAQPRWLNHLSFNPTTQSAKVRIVRPYANLSALKGSLVFPVEVKGRTFKLCLGRDGLSVQLAKGPDYMGLVDFYISEFSSDGTCNARHDSVCMRAKSSAPKSVNIYAPTQRLAVAVTLEVAFGDSILKTRCAS